jgi:hypothetical protein
LERYFKRHQASTKTVLQGKRESLCEVRNRAKQKNIKGWCDLKMAAAE